MRGVLRNHLMLWAVAVVLAPLASHMLYGSGSVDFLMGTTSLPALDGGSVYVPRWSAIPLSQVWHYLILSIAGGISLATIIAVIARCVIAQNWKCSALWLSGLLCITLLAYVTSLLAYRPGAWQRVGLLVFYNTRGPLWPTLVFTAVILAAKLLSNAAQSGTGKNILFLILSGLAITSALMTFAVPVALSPSAPSLGKLATALIVLNACMYAMWAVLVVFALARLAAISSRKSTS